MSDLQKTRESLLPPSASAVERNIENTTLRSSSIAVPVKDTWNPNTCPENMLPWLAWALSVDNWDSRWPTEIKREVIRESVLVHRKKGTRKAVERSLRALGVRIELEEWFESEDEQEPHTFTLTALAQEALNAEGEAIIDQNFYDTVRNSVDAAKPVRSHYQLRVGAKYGSAMKVGTALTGTSVLCDEVEIKTDPIVRKLSQTLATAIEGANVLRLTMVAKGETTV